MNEQARGCRALEGMRSLVVKGFDDSARGFGSLPLTVGSAKKSPFKILGGLFSVSSFFFFFVNLTVLHSLSEICNLVKYLKKNV